MSIIIIIIIIIIIHIFQGEITLHVAQIANNMHKGDNKDDDDDNNNNNDKKIDNAFNLRDLVLQESVKVIVVCYIKSSTYGVRNATLRSTDLHHSSLPSTLPCNGMT
jgi:hypothetical protein